VKTNSESTVTTAKTVQTTAQTMPTNGVNTRTGSVRTGDDAPTALIFTMLLMGATAVALRKRREDA
jgi:LPXTG-motif cell wall-anchored protein